MEIAENIMSDLSKEVLITCGIKLNLILDFEQLASDLRRDGVVVISFLNSEQVSEWNSDFWKICNEFPEYSIKATKEKPIQRVLGGFGAFGNPGSFHHPLVRKWRKIIKETVSKPLFKEYELQNKGPIRNLELLFDRMGERRKIYKQPMAEAWHRDIYDAKTFGLRKLSDSDTIFGGWINLNTVSGDKRDQFFVGVKETHKGPDFEQDISHGKGFALIPENRHEYYKQLAIKYTGKDKSGQPNGIKVPPGSIVIFPQRLCHSVKSGPQPNEPSVRLFLGHRLTLEKVPLFENLEDVINRQAVPRIPSGQIPPMYSSNHYSHIKNILIPWSGVFKDKVLFDRQVESGNDKGLKYKTPGSKINRILNSSRAMGSLEEFDMKFPEYSREDIEVLMPEVL